MYILLIFEYLYLMQYYLEGTKGQCGEFCWETNIMQGIGGCNVSDSEVVKQMVQSRATISVQFM